MFAHGATVDAMFAFRSQDRKIASEHSTFKTHACRMPAAVVAGYNEVAGHYRDGGPGRAIRYVESCLECEGEVSWSSR